MNTLGVRICTNTPSLSLLICLFHCRIVCVCVFNTEQIYYILQKSRSFQLNLDAYATMEHATRRGQRGLMSRFEQKKIHEVAHTNIDSRHEDTENKARRQSSYEKFHFTATPSLQMGNLWMKNICRLPIHAHTHTSASKQKTEQTENEREKIARQQQHQPSASNICSFARQIEAI